MTTAGRAGGDQRARPRGRPADLDRVLEGQRDGCREIGSELYARLLDRILERVHDPGPVRDLLAPHAADSFGSALALRFLGAVHRVVLEGRAPELGSHYPSVGGTPGPGLEDAFEATVAEHVAELAVRIADGVQTNEVGRSASLLGALLEVASLGLPLRVFEAGASAGLNLRWDYYRYEAGGTAFGDPASPVRFVDSWTSSAPRLDQPCLVVERRGCDRSPIDATTEDGRLTLRSYVWPDLVERFTRLDAAIEVARRVPAPVDAADAPGWVAERLARPAPGTSTVVMHSIVQQYLGREARQAMIDAIVAAGAAASPDAPLAWVRMEPGHDGAEVRCTIWPAGEERLLAISGYHGPPIRWVG